MVSDLNKSDTHSQVRLTMNSDTFVVILGQESCFKAAYVSALGEVFRKPKVGHQLIDDAGGVLYGPVLVEWEGCAERIAWQRWNNDVVREVLLLVLVFDQFQQWQELDEAS
jgi:hypothetical protein